jgi:hypothetical protein
MWNQCKVVAELHDVAINGLFILITPFLSAESTLTPDC